MAKFYGPIGYAISSEIRPGVWKDTVTEKPYPGDVIRNTSKWTTTSDSTNDDLNVSNQISIIADPFAYQNFHCIKYVEFMGAKWKVTSVDVQHPRLLLTLGGVYNGPQT